MTDVARARSTRQFGEGPLARVAALVYTLLIVELLLVLTTLPGLVPLILLDRDASNIPLAAVCALPLGPALSAALYAVQRRRADLTDLHPGTTFWRGYRMNLKEVLKIWVPLLLGLDILAVNVGHLDAAGVPRWWALLLIALAVVASLWGVNALVITSLFTFRAIDIARLAAYFLVRRFGATLANLCLLVVAVGITVYSSEAVLALLGSVFSMALLYNARAMIAAVKRDFTA